jgi:basic amino acid/polyamine antiporter, APA family
VRAAGLGLWSGVGINVSAMIGVGIFISAGFMAETMGPAQILLAWVVGGLLAMAGARAYAELAALVPRSGGEYRFLSELLHPWLGCMAGWASLLAGFSAPVAASAKALVPFAGTLAPGLELTHAAAALIVAVTLLHALDLGVSRRAQDALASAKVLLIAGFVAVGLLLGRHALPADTPPGAAGIGLVRNFMEQLVFVIYAYLGWNTAAYAAEEFRDPRRTVPRSMVLGAAAVTVIYLLINWIFVANPAPAGAAPFAEIDASRITLGHIVTVDLIGPVGGQVMSVLVIVSLASAISAMTLVGPRVYQAMARDGFLPRVFAGAPGRPPRFAVLLQGALALVLFYTHELGELVADVSAVLTLTSALAVATLYRLRFGRAQPPRPGAVPLACATLFIVVSAWVLVFQVTRSRPGNLVLWLALLVVAATLGHLARRRGRPAA